MPEETNIEYRVKRLEEDSERNQVTHKEFFSRFETIKAASAKTDVQYANIIATVSEIKAGLEELKGKPAKRWDALIAALISAVAGVLIGFLLKGGV